MEKEIKKEVVDIADFFTTTRSKEGIWYEPKVDGIGIGIEFKIFGPASDKAILALDEYLKEHEKAKSEADEKTAVEIERNALASRAAAVVGGVRAKGGKAIVCNKKDFKGSKDEIRTVMYENEDICVDLITAASRNATFMRKR